MKKTKNNAYVYFRYPDPSLAFIENDPITKMIFDNDELIDNKCNEWYLAWDECLGNVKPIDRYGFTVFLSTIYDRNVRTLFLVNLTDISTEPKVLVTTLYDLVQRVIEVVVLSDGRIINRKNLASFNYCSILVQVKKLIEQNSDDRFELLVHKDGCYDIWHDSLEKTFYLYDIRTSTMHLIELTGVVEKGKWDNNTLKPGEYKAFCCAADYSQLYETITYKQTKYYVWFRINFDAEKAGCGVTLDNEVLNET